MRFNNNRNFEKFQENIKQLKKTSMPVDEEERATSPVMIVDTSQVVHSKVRYQPAHVI